MLTLFSIPKAFSGESQTIQSNAIGSWRRLGADCQLIMFGDEEGIGEAAERFGALHVPEVARTPHGTPIVSDAFSRAEQLARFSTLCFVNADIILLDDFLTTVRTVSALCRQFLIISSRFDLQIDGALEFARGWDQDLRRRVRMDGKMYPSGGSDVFVYPRGLFAAMPPFAIGRGYWDNWLMYRAVQSGARMIDATELLTAVHQNHHYRHVPGIPVSSDIFDVLRSDEARLNLALAGGKGHIFTAYDSTDILTDGGQIVSTLRPSLISRRLKAWIRRTAAVVTAGRGEKRADPARNDR